MLIRTNESGVRVETVLLDGLGQKYFTFGWSWLYSSNIIKREDIPQYVKRC